MPDRSWLFDALGTSWIISGDGINEDVRRVVVRWLEEFDTVFSRFRDDSQITRLARIGGALPLTPQQHGLFTLYETLYQLSDGKISPLVARSLEQAGYDARYSLHNGSAEPAPRWEDVLDLGRDALTFKHAALIDIGAIGKGFAVDAVFDLLKEHGVSRVVVDASGDIRLDKDVSEVIGLENPTDADRVIGTVDIIGGALCASGANRRRWAEGKWHHIIDATTGIPVSEYVAVWVVADTAMLADALATALFFIDPDTLSPLGKFSYARVSADGVLDYSTDFHGQWIV